MTVTPQWIADKYEARGVLGEGGTGIVYDAVRVADGAPVALKVMHAQLAGDVQIRGRFQREAVILRRLEGPHVCPILDFGEVPAGEDGKTLLYLALPKLDGPSLEQVLRAEGLLPVDRALDLMLQICAALRAAHGQGVIHRDLKPANVILVGAKRPGGAQADDLAPLGDAPTRLGAEAMAATMPSSDEGETAVVVDFGMSKIVTGSGTGTTNLTAHNMLFGTPEYMSPEQARGDELDARCDVYSAGIMLYELLAGEPPFTGPTPLGVLTLHLTSDLEPPSKRAPAGRIPRAVESVVMHALARDPEKRYPSASALASAIRHARSAPDDFESLRPEAFSTSPAGTDAFAATMPGFLPPPISEGTLPKGSSPKAIVSSSPRLASSRPPPPRSGAIPPASSSRAMPPSRPSSSPPGRGGAQLRAKVSPDETMSRTWIAIWVVAGLASIGAGIYLALR